MSTPERAGWFDDPEDDSQLRYFDGIIWSDRTVPRHTPAKQTAAPSDPTAAQGHPGTDVFGRSTAGAGRQPHAQQPWSGQQRKQGQPGPAGWGAPQQAGWTHPGTTPEPTTVDGQPLAGYGARVGAYLIDMIIVGVLNLLVSGWAFWRGTEDYRALIVEVAQSGNQEVANNLTPEEVVGLFDLQYLLIGMGLSLLVFAIYHVAFLAVRNATPGKMMLGLSVRRTERPGRFGIGTAFMRILLPLGVQVISLLPLVGYLLFFVSVADLVWPIKDQRRQALHDKIAGTQVVKGKQHRGSVAQES